MIEAGGRDRSGRPVDDVGDRWSWRFSPTPGAGPLARRPRPGAAARPGRYPTAPAVAPSRWCPRSGPPRRHRRPRPASRQRCSRSRCIDQARSATDDQGIRHHVQVGPIDQRREVGSKGVLPDAAHVRGRATEPAAAWQHGRRADGGLPHGEVSPARVARNNPGHADGTAIAASCCSLPASASSTRASPPCDSRDPITQPAVPPRSRRTHSYRQ